jgi:hypothetical protein
LNKISKLNEIQGLEHYALLKPLNLQQHADIPPDRERRCGGPARVGPLSHQGERGGHDQRRCEEDQGLVVVTDQSFKAGQCRHPSQDQQGTAQVLVDRPDELVLLVDAEVRVEEHPAGHAGGYAPAESGQAGFVFRGAGCIDVRYLRAGRSSDK